MYEHFFQCPHCWERISVVLDTSAGEQRFVEDCEVCCNPMDIKVQFENRELVLFEMNELGQ